MQGTSVLRNTAFTMVGQLLARLLALLLYAMLARTVGPERYGDIAFGLALGTLGMALMEPGLNPLLIRDGARSREVLRVRFAEALGYKLVALLVVWPALIGLGAAMGVRGHALNAVVLGSGTILLVTFEDLSASALTAVERLDLEGALRFLSKVLGASLGLIAILLAGSFETILAAIWLAALLTGMVGFGLTRRAAVPVSIALRPRDLLDRIAQIWPLTASSMMWMLVLRMDQVIAGAMGVDHFDLGNYGAAVKLVEALVLFPGAVATAFQPRLARAWADSAPACSRQLRAALTASLALSVPIAVGGACLAPGLSILVYGDRFLSAGSLLAIQLLCLPFIGIQFLSTHALVAAGAIRVQALAVAVNLLVNLGCNLLLIPQLGVKGASASALCGGFAATLVYAWALRGTRLRPELLASAWRPVLSAAAMGLLLMEVRDRLPLFAAIGVGGAVYAAAFLSLGGLRALREMRGRGEPVKVPAARIELGER